MKIHLCAGDVYLKGYENCDITGKVIKSPPTLATTLDNYYLGREIGNKQPTVIDRRMNVLRFPWPWMADSVDEVVMIQAVEHFVCRDALSVVTEIKNILKPGGSFLVDFPDIQATVVQYMDHNPDFCMRFIYCNHKNKYSIHHWGYTRKTFAQLLGEGWKLNFRNIVEHDYPVIGCEAIKL